MSEIKIEIEGNAQYATIKKLSSSDANGEPIGKETILDLLKKSNIIYGIDEKVIEFYVNAALQSEKPLLDIVVASRTTPLDLGSNYPKLNFEAPYSIDDAVVWNMFDNYFSDFRFDKYYNFPYKLKYAKKGDVLAHLLNSKKKVVGKNIKGKEISSKQVQNEYYAGENVHYDEKRKAFIAGAEGFLLYKNGTFSIKRPYFPTSDRMQLFALNLPTIKEFEITNNDILLFCKQKKIIRNILPNREQIKEKNNHILVIEGKQVVNGKDGELELFYSTEKSVGKVDENGKIDFKEKDHFKNTEEGDKLAIKTHPVEGSPGKDIYDNLIKPKPVKDINYRSGPGTRKEEQEDKFIVYSMTDGVIEFDDSYVSVSPKVMIMGDIDYSSGNINTKANVEIKGTVKAGFKVISSRDIIIKGDVEDNCKIIANGDIDIGGGIHGENTYVESSGKLSTKFIEFSKIKSKGQINVLRFCMGAEITCSDNIIIFGQEINLDTHGAMVECDIKVKKLLMCPVIGNSKGNANSITFGYDKQIEKRIINTRETIKGLKAQIQSLEDKASEFVDLRRKNILPDLKKLAKSIKDKVLGYIQDKKNIEKKLDMMQKIYDSSIQKRDKIVKESRIKVDRKIFPKFVLHCKGITKTYDHRILKSEFFFSFEKMDITLD